MKVNYLNRKNENGLKCNNKCVTMVAKKVIAMEKTALNGRLDYECAAPKSGMFCIREHFE